MSIDELLALEPQAKDQLQKVWLGYTESKGNPELRNLVSTLYNATADSGIIIHSGAQEAIYNFFKSVLKSGDQIVVLTPTYQSLYSIARDSGIAVSELKLKETASGWEIALSELDQLVTSATKAVVLNVPNNPTGFLLQHDEFKEVINICRKNGAILFSDEVYRGLERAEPDRLPAACDVYEKGVSLGVLSKTYGLAGLRIGWVATRCAEVFDRMCAFKDYLTICNRAPSEFLAGVALKNHDEISRRNREIIRQNMKSANSFFEEFSNIFEWHEPIASPISFVRMKTDRADEFCSEARKGAQTLLLPSTVFDYGDRHVRFGFGRRNFGKAIQHFSTFLRNRK